MKRVRQWASLASWLGGMLALLMIVAPLSALAHEEEGVSPKAAEAVAPGLLGLGALLLAAVVVGAWYHFQRQAMLRRIRQEYQSREGSGGRSSEGR